jgi:hypothetical protein
VQEETMGDVFGTPGPGPNPAPNTIRLPENAQTKGMAESPRQVGVYGHSSQNVAVWGRSESAVGVCAETNNVASPALEARSLNPNGQAAKFDGHVYITGNVTVAMDIILPNAGDLAEDFNVCAGQSAEPGTVMSFEPDGSLSPAVEPYDRRVAGIVAGAGSLRPGVILDRHPTPHSRAPIALTGKVFCKVDADLAPIKAGDLLTSSPTAGHAMRASDDSRMTGAIIGKAMKSVKTGRSLIPVLVTR